MAGLDWDRSATDFCTHFGCETKSKVSLRGGLYCPAFTLYGSQQQYGEDVLLRRCASTHKNHLAFECEILSMDRNQPASLTVRAYSSLSPAPEQCCQTIYIYLTFQFGCFKRIHMQSWKKRNINEKLMGKWDNIANRLSSCYRKND